MRTFIFSALAVATFGLLTLAPASAAPYWECMGTGVGCGSSHASAGSSYNYRSQGRVYADRAAGRVASRRTASRRSPSPRHAYRAEPRQAPVQVASAERESRSSGGPTQSGMASYYGTEFGFADRVRRPLQPQRHDGRASFAAVRHQGSGDEQAQRPLGRGHHQ